MFPFVIVVIRIRITHTVEKRIDYFLWLVRCGGSLEAVPLVAWPNVWLELHARVSARVTRKVPHRQPHLDGDHLVEVLSPRVARYAVVAAMLGDEGLEVWRWRHDHCTRWRPVPAPVCGLFPCGKICFVCFV